MSQMIPRPVMPPSSSNHYDLNQPYQAAQYNNPKKIGKPHGIQIFFHTSHYSSINVLSNKPRTSLFSVPIHFSFPVKAFIDTGAFSSAIPLYIS